MVDMKTVSDDNSTVFYFTADGKVDFAELIGELAAQFQTRIICKQIGSRDLYVRTVCKENFALMNRDIFAATSREMGLRFMDLEWQGPKQCDCVVFFTANETVDSYDWEWFKKLNDELARDAHPKTIELKQMNL
jgi:uncharacterized protein YfaT (DUF1175 family)